MVSDFRPHESYQFFLQEVPDLLQTLEDGLLNLHRDHGLAKMNLLLRATHSLKGGAACVGLHQIQVLAHHLETIFQACAEPAVSIDLELESLILQAFDCLKMCLLEEIQTGQSDAIAAVAIDSPVWQELATKLAIKRPIQAVKPHQLFVKDIEKGLHRLSSILAQPGDHTIALGIQLNILKGLGEIAQLDRLTQISDNALLTIRQNPKLATTIGRSTLEALNRVYALLQSDLDDAATYSSFSPTQGPVNPNSDIAAASEQAQWWNQTGLETSANRLDPPHLILQFQP